MKRRWKVGITLAVVGLAGFLVWAFLSPVTPPLSIRFQRYVTNALGQRTGSLPADDGAIFVLFAVTNQTGRSVVVIGHSESTDSSIKPDDLATWTDSTNFSTLLGPSVRFLKAGEGALVGARVHPNEQFIKVIVEGRLYRSVGPAWSHFRHRMPWNQGRFSVSATNQLR